MSRKITLASIVENPATKLPYAQMSIEDLKEERHHLLEAAIPNYSSRYAFTNPDMQVFVARNKDPKLDATIREIDELIAQRIKEKKELYEKWENEPRTRLARG